MKLLIIGHGRHGKDELAKIFQERYGLSCTSSSLAAAKIFLYKEMKGKFGYKTFEECYEDRHNHRDYWFDKIVKYNKKDPARLAKEILKNSDIYVGMRSSVEIQECMSQGLFDNVIWIERPDTPLESKGSFNITEKDAKIKVINDGTLKDLEKKVDVYMRGHEAYLEMCKNWIIIEK